MLAHKGGDGRNYGIRNDLPAYRLANLFMLAYPYGYPKVMSSYAFGNGELWRLGNPGQDVVSVAGMGVRDDFLGPPHLGSHRDTLTAADYSDAAAWRTAPVWQTEAAGNAQNTCLTYEQALADAGDGSKWLCEHRWPGLAGMTGFRAATASAWRLDNLWDAERNRIAFGRGDQGFAVFNGELWSEQTAFGPEGNGWFQTGLAAGRYCDVVHSRLSSDRTRCLDEAGREVAPVDVAPDGKARFVVDKMDAKAIHVNARLF